MLMNAFKKCSSKTQIENYTFFKNYFDEKKTNFKKIVVFRESINEILNNECREANSMRFTLVHLKTNVCANY